MAGETERQIIRWASKLSDALDTSPEADPAKHAWTQLEPQIHALVEERYPTLKRPEGEWSSRLLVVARQDLGAARLLLEAGEHPAVWCMLLQMAFEKIAKAAIARVDVQCFRKVRVSHAVLPRFFAVLRRQLKNLGFPRHEFQIAKATLLAIERAHPALTRAGPHLEYPWEDDHGVYTPGEDLPLLQLLTDSKNAHAVRVLRFGSALLNRFDELF